MNDVFVKIAKLKLVPVVKIEKAEDALALGQALLTGGLPLAEITFQTDAAEEAIRILSRDLPDMLIGAGTVLTVDNVKRAVDAGAVGLHRVGSARDPRWRAGDLGRGCDGVGRVEASATQGVTAWSGRGDSSPRPDGSTGGNSRGRR